jgi:hypothetical protein
MGTELEVSAQGEEPVPLFCEQEHNHEQGKEQLLAAAPKDAEGGETQEQEKHNPRLHA